MSLSATTGQSGTAGRIERAELQEAGTMPPSYEDSVGVAAFETGLRYDGEEAARMAQLSQLLGLSEAEEPAPESFVAASSAPLLTPQEAEADDYCASVDVAVLGLALPRVQA
jgi:hypothetical protein